MNQDDKTFEAAEDLVDRWLKGYLEGQFASNKKWVPMIQQLCRDLNEAHNEILRQQGIVEADFNKYDWPEWSPQANSIRWAERETRTRLAKTDQWTMYSTSGMGTDGENGKTGLIS